MMVCTRKLMLMILPGLAPLLVRGLQVEPTASSAAAASQLSQPAPKKKRVLLIMAGLARHMEVTWPALEKAIVLPNEQAGYTFKMVFSTNASLECHRDSPRWRSRKCEEPVSDPTEHVGRIKRFFGARNVEVLHDTGVCVPYRPGQNFRESRQPDGDDDVGLPQPDGDDDADLPQSRFDSRFRDRWEKVPCAPWWERVHRVLAKTLESGEKFDRVVALRPDILVLGPTSCKAEENCNFNPSLEPPRLQLDKMCAEKPGISFVNPSYQVRKKSYFHDKDLDFLHILCPGEELPTYEEAIRVPLEPCSHEPYPALPPGFSSSKGWHDKALYCRFAQVFAGRNVSISHWDGRYTIGWPHSMGWANESA
jgi:hypothetical protein